MNTIKASPATLKSKATSGSTEQLIQIFCVFINVILLDDDFRNDNRNQRHGQERVPVSLQEAGIEDFRFHDCRHTAITRMIQAGIPATETMKISGHTQFVTFARYVGVNEQRREKEQQGSPNILRNPARTNCRS
ncbi:MAG TPA: tyrosine-type recombinase/integrase [Pyrinomonadaceae bacterium]|nr:tyrosine-type recombinase/integrase [Pyrinomonadaceae bacterium]